MALEGKKIAFLVASEGIEQVELTEPWATVEQGAGQPVLLVAGGDASQVQAYNHLDKADTFDVDLPVSRANPEDYDGLVLPGGVTNGDQVRTDPTAVAFAAAFLETGKPVAVVCHGGWVLVETGLLKGRRMTSWPSLQTDVRNTGGEWVDEEVVVDTSGPGPLVSSRKPDDLPAFTKAIADVF
ncbi:MAG TPA: type 1 glutamine amidotransferase domain-containing protein [Kineosporiaceae bacterium]|nr:type 1 glutamine amidotransferase domain-containing protein [Kineosporiaceae bacterium]